MNKKGYVRFAYRAQVKLFVVNTVSVHYPLPVSDLFETIAKKFLKSNFPTKTHQKCVFGYLCKSNFHVLETFLQWFQTLIFLRMSSTVLSHQISLINNIAFLYVEVLKGRRQNQIIQTKGVLSKN